VATASYLVMSKQALDADAFPVTSTSSSARKSRLLMSCASPAGFGSGLVSLCGARKVTPSLARGRSNRHDPYHALDAATGRNRRQQFSPDYASFAPA
jgi:hypothetical protein